MAVINGYRHTKFDSFTEWLSEFPFLRIALFAFIAYLVFILMGFKAIGRLSIFMVPMALIGRAFSFWLCGVEHTLTKFWLTSLFAGIEGRLLFAALRPILSVGYGVIAILVIDKLSALALLLAGIVFLIRIFVALFG